MAVVTTSKSKKSSKRSRADEELIEKSLKRFKIASEAESATRQQGLEDLKFSIGTGQWDAAVKANREIEGKPCLVVNRAPSFLRQFTGDERQHRPAMIVDPVGSGADPEVADIYQGVLRHIEVASFADTVYDNSYDMMLRIGWDYWRIATDYVDEMSFFQEPRIVGIENPFAVFMSPVRKPDGTDPLWCHVIQDLSKDEYKEKYPNSEMSRINFGTQLGNAEPSWVTKDGVRIAEYFWLELERKMICLLPDGTSKFKDELAPDMLELIEDERETIARKVCWVKHNAIEVLETNSYLGKYIPIVEVSGVRLNVDGQVYRSGIVRDYRDAQRIYDFMVTRSVEQVDLTGKDPLLVAEGSIKGHEEEYRQMNRKNYAYLYYKSVNDNGQQLPPPTRANREPPIQAMQMLIRQADYDMKAVIGIYGAGPGEMPTPNESAFGVLTREQQQGTGSVNWSDNLNRSIRWQGKMLIDLFPKLITAPRIQRIINPDDSIRHAVVFNSEHSAADDAQALLNPAKEIKKIYDVGTGSYDVTMSTGPAYRTARQEAFRAITAIVTSQPDLFPIVGDIWVKYADWPGANVLADRLKKMLPANLQDPNDSDPAAQVVTLQSQLQQLSTQHNQLVAELARASDTIRTKRLDLESRERIAQIQAQAGMIEAALKANFAAGLEQMKAELATIQNRMELLHESMSIEQEAGVPPETPELPTQVEPKTQPVTPAAPVTPVKPIGGPQ